MKEEKDHQEGGVSVAFNNILNSNNNIVIINKRLHNE